MSSAKSSSQSRKAKRFPKEQAIDPNRNCPEFQELLAACKACDEWEDRMESMYEEDDKCTISGFLAHFQNELNGHGDQNDCWESNVRDDPTGKCLKEAKIGFVYFKQLHILYKKNPHLMDTLMAYEASMTSSATPMLPPGSARHSGTSASSSSSSSFPSSSSQSSSSKSKPSESALQAKQKESNFNFNSTVTTAKKKSARSGHWSVTDDGSHDRHDAHADNSYCDNELDEKEEPPKKKTKAKKNSYDME